MMIYYSTMFFEADKRMKLLGQQLVVVLQGVDWNSVEVFWSGRCCRRFCASMDVSSGRTFGVSVGIRGKSDSSIGVSLVVF